MKESRNSSSRGLLIRAPSSPGKTEPVWFGWFQFGGRVLSRRTKSGSEGIGCGCCKISVRLVLGLCGQGRLFLYQFHRKMNFSLSLKENRLKHTCSTTELSAYKPYFTFFNPPSTKTLPVTPLSLERESKMKNTDYRLFRERQQNNEEPEISCLALVTLPSPNPFVTVADLNRLDFPALAYPLRQLAAHARTIIEASPERRAIGKSFNLLKLIELLAENYNVTAYHNFTHAFSVLQLLYQSYNRSDTLRKTITEKQWFYVFIAALAHDLHHPGTNNAFEIKKKSALAAEAGNESVLEKMHLNRFWNLLKKHSQVNFLQGYSSHESADIKKFITRLVLSTDAAKHFKGLEVLRQVGKGKKGLEGENAMVVVEQLFHACDIGNPCLDFENYVNWAALVTYEFDQIALKEKEMGFEVTGYLKYSNLKGFYRDQFGFCNGFVLPLWRELFLILPGLDEIRENLNKNIKELERKKQLQP